MSETDGIEYTCTGDCLRIRLRHDDILLQPGPAMQRIAGIVARCAPLVTLIDFREVKAPATFGRLYNLGEAAALHLAGRTVVALIRPDQADRGEIGRLVANNRGADVVRFTDAVEAEAWIRARLPSRPPP